MVPLVIDTGASVTVTPYVTDFTSVITPVQSVEIKGIAEGLQVHGTGTVSYKYYNDAGNLVTLDIPNYLYVPQCTARLLCPRQVATITNLPDDGFYAKQNSSTLYFNGQPTTHQVYLFFTPHLVLPVSNAIVPTYPISKI
jgi:hypothetical protein